MPLKCLLANLLIVLSAISYASSAQPNFLAPGDTGGDLEASSEIPSSQLKVLGDDAPGLLEKHYLRRIQAQYDARREAVRTALQSRELIEKRRQKLKDGLRRIVGELPEKTPLRAQVTGVIEAEGYRIEKVVYQSRPHHYVTANLYVPTASKGPFPGVLIACGHSSLGKAYEPYQRAAILMAKNRMVALVYDPIGQGERLSYLEGSGNPGLQHKLDNVNAILVGRTAVGYQAWDGIRSLDYLLSLPEVDRKKPVGMTGNSGGGAQTMYLMALDDRIGPAAPSCHITTLERNFELGGAGDGCQSAPLTGYFGMDHPDFFALRAPQPSIILSAEKDYKDIRFTRKTFAEAKKVFALLGASDRMAMFAYNDGHAFSQPRREAAATWMKRWLWHDPSPVGESKAIVQKARDLQVTDSGQVLREFSGALSVSDLNLIRARELYSKRKSFWREHSQSEVLDEIRGRIGVAKSPGSPHIIRHGIVDRGAYRIQKLALQRDDQIPLPALLFLPRALKGEHATTILADSRGKAVEAKPGGMIEKLLADGQVVLSIDLRGFGETTEPLSKVIYVQGDHRAAMWSLHLGKTLLGQRVEEVLMALDFLLTHPRVNAREIHLVGVRQAGPVALHAAALDPRFASVTLKDSIRSWMDEVMANPRDITAISHIVPGALALYDLPDLASMLGQKLSFE